VIARLPLGQTETTIQAYDFWSDDDISNPDIVPEVEKVVAARADIVIAKSIGTFIAMTAWQQSSRLPAYAVFMGTPVQRLEALGKLDLLRDYSARATTLFIQQRDDFNGPYAKLKDAISPGARAIEILGGDHLYEDVERITDLIRRWRTE
jgi:hypothetical protein